MLKATYYFVASTGVYTGAGFGRSPKAALAAAKAAADSAMCAGDAAVGYVSGIAVEGWSLINPFSGRVLGSFCDL